MLAEEFGVDRMESWRVSLREGRATWRRRQLAASVRDAPETAATALVGLGYQVFPPEAGHPADDVARLGSP